MTSLKEQQLSNLTLLQNFIRPEPSGVLEVRINLVEVVDGIADRFTIHRTAITPNDEGDPVGEAVAAENANLQRGVSLGHGETLSFPPLSDAAVDRIRQWATERWTPEVLAMWRQRRADEGAAAEEARKQEAERIAAAKQAEDEAAAAQEQRFREMVAAEVAAQVKGGKKA